MRDHSVDFGSRCFPVSALALSVLIVVASCGHGAAVPPDDARQAGADVGQARGKAAEPAPLPMKPVVRAQSEALTRLRSALDHGRVEEARGLLAEAQAPEPEASLLRARVSALEGHDTDAMRSIEEARKLAPNDPSVFATAAEIYGGMSKAHTAWSEVVHGEELCGPSPEFLRARGILSISQPGGALKGLALLEQARAADPGIPFIDRALGQAHLLAAKDRAKAKDFPAALEHVQASLTFDPDDVDARRFHSEMLTATGDYKGAIAVLKALVDKGEPLEAELALTLKNAAMLALLAHDRDEALADFVAARKYGLSEKELSSGAAILEQEARVQLDLGVTAYEKPDLDAAEQHFRRALEYAPDSIQAENHLAIVLFKKKQFTESVRLWQRVIATARAEKLDLPEPVHINLARAQVQAGDREGAVLTLEEYIDREPAGQWLAETRAMLASLSSVARSR